MKKLKAFRSGAYGGQFRQAGDVFDLNPYEGMPRFAEVIEDDSSEDEAPRKSEFAKFALASANAQNGDKSVEVSHSSDDPAKPRRGRPPKAKEDDGADLV